MKDLGYSQSLGFLQDFAPVDVAEEDDFLPKDPGDGLILTERGGRDDISLIQFSVGRLVREVIHRCLDEVQTCVIEALFFEGRTLKETAGILGISVRQVVNIRTASFKKMRQCTMVQNELGPLLVSRRSIN